MSRRGPANSARFARRSGSIAYGVVMSGQHILRRASYGSTSPDVGSLGARTRQRIAENALQCFTEKGFHGTVIEDIAASSGVSRATLYQYFESKEAIFLELVQEGGADFLSLARAARPLGPDRQGFESLHSWISEWTREVDRYSTLFVEWGNVNSRKAPLRPRLAWFVERHTAIWSKRLSEAGFQGVSAEAMAILMLAVNDRYNYSRLVFRPAASRSVLIDNLAVAFQLALFPETRRTAFASVEGQSVRTPDEVGTLRRRAQARRGRGKATPLPMRDVFAGLSDQAASTVRQLLDAAGVVFANNGYAASNVDLIVTEAGLARGTFYKYFKQKSELLATLTHECAAAMGPALRDLAAVGGAVDQSVALRDWLRNFLRIQHTYSAVLRAWTERQPDEPAIMGPNYEIVAMLTASVTELLAQSGRTDRLDIGATTMILAALLERFPEESAGTRYQLSEDEVVEAQAVFIERVLLGPPRRRRPSRP